MDWNNPTNTSDRLQVLGMLKDRDASLAVWFDGISDTNIPNNTKRWNATNKRFEKWNGSGWLQMWPELDTHLASTSNPHATTAAQVGAPDLSTFNAHVSNTSNPHSVTAAQVGAPTLASFNSHTTNTSNPHNTTAAQTGACAIANNLSELSATQSTARSNIGAASAATLSSHTSNTSNPHNVTRGQIGAAASGANSDITSLSAVTSVRAAAAMRVGPTSGNLTFASPSQDRIILDDSGNLYPFSTGGMNLGTSSNWWNGITANVLEAPSANHLMLSAAGDKEVRIRNNGTHWWTFGSFGILTPTTNGTLDIGIDGTNPINNLYFKGKVRNNGPVQSWSFFSFTPLTSLNPSGATATDCANAINSIAKYLENLGLVN